MRSDVIGLIIETYLLTGKKVPVVYNNEYLLRLIKRTKTDEYMGLYKSIGELPNVPVTSSQ